MEWTLDPDTRSNTLRLLQRWQEGRGAFLVPSLKRLAGVALLQSTSLQEVKSQLPDDLISFLASPERSPEQNTLECCFQNIPDFHRYVFHIAFESRDAPLPVRMHAATLVRRSVSSFNRNGFLDEHGPAFNMVTGCMLSDENSDMRLCCSTVLGELTQSYSDEFWGRYKRMLIDWVMNAKTEAEKHGAIVSFIGVIVPPQHYITFTNTDRERGCRVLVQFAAVDAPPVYRKAVVMVISRLVENDLVQAQRQLELGISLYDHALAVVPEFARSPAICAEPEFLVLARAVLTHAPRVFDEDTSAVIGQQVSRALQDAGNDDGVISALGILKNADIVREPCFRFFDHLDAILPAVIRYVCLSTAEVAAKHLGPSLDAPFDVAGDLPSLKTTSTRRDLARQTLTTLAQVFEVELMTPTYLTIAPMLTSEDPVVVECALQSLGTLAHPMGTYFPVLREGYVETILRVLRSPQVPLHETAFFAVTFLSIFETDAASLDELPDAEREILSLLPGLLSSRSEDVRRQAARHLPVLVNTARALLTGDFALDVFRETSAALERHFEAERWEELMLTAQLFDALIASEDPNGDEVTPLILASLEAVEQVGPVRLMLMQAGQRIVAFMLLHPTDLMMAFSITMILEDMLTLGKEMELHTPDERPLIAGLGDFTRYIANLVMELVRDYPATGDAPLRGGTHENDSILALIFASYKFLAHVAQTGVVPGPEDMVDDYQPAAESLGEASTEEAVRNHIYIPSFRAFAALTCSNLVEHARHVSAMAKVDGMLDMFFIWPGMMLQSMRKHRQQYVPLDEDGSVVRGLLAAVTLLPLSNNSTFVLTEIMRVRPDWLGIDDIMPHVERITSGVQSGPAESLSWDNSMVFLAQSAYTFPNQSPGILASGLLKPAMEVLAGDVSNDDVALDQSDLFRGLAVEYASLAARDPQRPIDNPKEVSALIGALEGKDSAGWGAATRAAVAEMLGLFPRDGAMGARVAALIEQHAS